MSQPKIISALFAFALALIATTVLTAQTRRSPPQPDNDPEYLETKPAYSQFVLLPRGGWPTPNPNDSSYETLRFGAPRIISFEAGEGYIEGDIIVGTREEIIAHEGLEKVLGAVIFTLPGETGRKAMLRTAGLIPDEKNAKFDEKDEKAAFIAFRKTTVDRVNKTIAFRVGTDTNLAKKVQREAERILDDLSIADGILSTTISLGRRWPNPMKEDQAIEYTVAKAPGYVDYETWIKPAIEKWEKTGIRFKQVTTITKEKNGISFEGGSGCSSHVGMKGGVQVIRLASGCKNAVAHEIGHALGLFHEQSHPDRDQFVTIVWSNIKEGHEYNFAIKQNPGRTTVYDYGSIMHYAATAFARNKNKPTIIPKDKTVKIGQRERLSPLDIQGIKLLYTDAPE